MSEPNLSSETQSAEFTAGDVKEAAGLSYRQLNDWESKGALGGGNREAKDGWRKFTAREVFVLMVCAEIRRQFGVPVESLAWVKSHMLQKEADYFAYAIETIGTYGFPVWLLTDLRETFIMDSDSEIEDVLSLGLLQSQASEGFILVQINPLVNRLLQCHKPPIQLKNHVKALNRLRTMVRELRSAKMKRQELLRLIRARAYGRVTVHLHDGKVLRAGLDEDLSKIAATKREGKIVTAIRKKKFSTVTVQMENGATYGLTHKGTIKFKMQKTSRIGKPNRVHGSRKNEW